MRGFSELAETENQKRTVILNKMLSDPPRQKPTIEPERLLCQVVAAEILIVCSRESPREKAFVKSRSICDVGAVL